MADEDRLLLIGLSTERYIVRESKFDTVVVDQRGKTYKGLGFSPIAEIKDGVEIPYTPRKRGEEIPGRQDVAADQVAALTAAGQDVPAAVLKAADVDPPAPSDPVPAPAAVPDADSRRTARPSR